MLRDGTIQALLTFSNGSTSWLDLLPNNPATVAIAAGGPDKVYQMHDNGNIYRRIAGIVASWEKVDINTDNARIYLGGGSGCKRYLRPP